MFAPRHVGRATGADDRPLIANIAVADLDRDGRADFSRALAQQPGHRPRPPWRREPGDRAHQRAIEAAPESPDAYTNIAGALMSQKRYDEALAALAMSVQIDPRHADAYNNRGIILAMTGRMDEARRSFEAALRLDPAHNDARRNLARLDSRP